MKIPNEGEEITLNGVKGYANTFTPQEMLTVYMGMAIFKNEIDEMMEFLSPSERQYQKELLNSVKSVMDKLKKTFKIMGIDVEREMRGM